MKINSALFHKTSLELTGTYLAIIMSISLVFSVANFRLSSAEIDRGYQRQEEFTQRLPHGVVTFNAGSDDFLQQRFNEAVLAKHNLLVKLVGINVLILVGGGFLSYFLARRSLQPIEEAHEAQSRFTADASHELRTPLTVMQTENEVALLNPKLTLADAKKQLQSNLEELAKLSALSEGLLRLAQLDENELANEPVRVDEIVNEAVQRLSASTSPKQLQFSPNKNSLLVLGDQSSLVEALVTILENAVKYSAKDSPVKVAVDKKDHYARVAVIDRGVGISKIDLPHIFNRFYRADNSRSKLRSSGYGLGLAIAQSIAGAHEGHIDVKSVQGKGTTFYVFLPLAPRTSGSQTSS